ncbi:MAG TPA: NAD-dependent epimerase/dehydratase family protein [Rhodanobacter sp.]|nr:NAD-dependent epimerase/dehydratase family protein [Rhodanobacter sp.]
MHVLITGGAGFIGSHLTSLHLSRGDKVHVVDDLSTGSRANLAAFEPLSNFRFDEADVLTWPLLQQAAAWADRVYHLAAVVGVYRVIAEPTRVLATNIAACERLFRTIAAGGWRPQVVVASSSEVYGHQHEDVLNETMDLSVSTRAGTRWNYSVSKIADEALALSYSQKFDIPVLVGRFFNTIGPRQVGRYGMVVPRFVDQAVRGEPITVYGDGEQTRSFCDVRDNVVAMDLLASRDSSDALVANIGNDREISMNALAQLICERAESDSKICHVPYLKAYGEDFEDIKRRRPSLDRLRTLTGFKHRYTLEDTLDELIQERRTTLTGIEHGYRTLVCNQS